ncbi:MAG: hypothetical protein QXT45_05450 [Candidatus Bilamarchaeaceae archaeon]
MAVLIDQITVGDLKILVLDDDPTVSPGYAAPIGSLAVVEGSAGLFQKTGSADTDWIIASVNSEDVEDIVGNLFIDSADIDFQYNDLANTMTAVLTTTGVTPGSYGNASTVPTFTVDSKGRLTVAGTASIDITASQVSDFTEAAQDAVGAALTDSSTIDFTYNDAANTITADVIQSGIDHGSISGLSDDDHAQYALLAGRGSGQTLNGGTNAGGSLTLSSTANATKGSIALGNDSAYDEANVRLGIGTTSPQSILHLTANNVTYNHILNSTTTSGATTTTIASLTTANNSVELVKVFITGIRTNGSNESVAYERTMRLRNNAGTLSILTFQSDYTSEDAALSPCNVSAVVSGTTADIRVTGTAGADITWRCVIHRIR